jgi:hypothetical protein
MQKGIETSKYIPDDKQDQYETFRRILIVCEWSDIILKTSLATVK